jgi:hypothetical protein
MLVFGALSYFLQVGRTGRFESTPKTSRAIIGAEAERVLGLCSNEKRKEIPWQ